VNQFYAKYLVYFPVQSLRGQRVTGALSKVELLELEALAKIHEVRDHRLSQIITRAYYAVPFYKERFVSAGVRPEQIRSLADLKQIPVLTKREVLDNEVRMIDPSFKEKLYTRKTGGSTGMTLHFQKEANALALNDAIMYRCYRWYGIDIGDRQARFWGVPVVWKLRWKEQIKDFVLNRIRISAFDISKESCLKQYDAIRRFRPSYFYGYTTAIYGFCLMMREMGVNLNDLALKAVICTAEKMYPHHRQVFNEVFKCPVVDEYGCAEHGIIAFQCKAHKLHMMSDHLCVEFLDEAGHPVGPGENGRIVITDLSSYAMPLIRYEIGDIGRYTEERCTCGVHLPLMEVVEGRKEDFIRTKEGKLVHAAYLCYTLKDDAVHEFKMYQKAIDRLHVQIVKSPSFREDSEMALESKLRTALGKEVSIDFEYLERIPRESSGKLRYFVTEFQ
jgi:phenylacetate-CoA ligase